MSENNLVNRLPKAGEKEFAADSQGAQLRALATIRSGPVRSLHVHAETTEPVRFFLHQNIRMLTQAPC